MTTLTKEVGPLDWQEIWARLAREAPTYLVGGAARRQLLGEEMPEDVDLATALPPSAVLSIFPEARPSGVAYGTVTIVAEGRRVDVTTLREEGSYRDRRRPEAVRFTTDLLRDLARRDFTIGAFAITPEGAVVDPFGGVADLRARRLRAVGDPAARFEEDLLRLVRALRLLAELDLTPDPLLVQEAEAKADQVAAVAGERRLAELLRLIVAAGVDRAWRLLPRVAAASFPFLTPLPVGHLPREPLPRLLRKARPGAAEVLASWGLGRRQAALLARAQAVPLRGPRPALRAAVAKAGAEAARLRALSAEGPLAGLLAAEGVWDRRRLALSARDLLALADRPPGPWLGALERHLLALVWQDPGNNTPAVLAREAAAFLRRDAPRLTEDGRKG
jgi:tRNA nucleotidyltransferase (CCA-adding enzyme)